MHVFIHVTVSLHLDFGSKWCWSLKTQVRTASFDSIKQVSVLKSSSQELLTVWPKQNKLTTDGLVRLLPFPVCFAVWSAAVGTRTCPKHNLYQQEDRTELHVAHEMDKHQERGCEHIKLYANVLFLWCFAEKLCDIRDLKIGANDSTLPWQSLIIFAPSQHLFLVLFCLSWLQLRSKA